MNLENGKKQYIILTHRTVNERCRYLVEAYSIEHANLLFEDGRADCVDANPIDIDETVREIVAEEQNSLAGGIAS
jgi:hypothetical protein